MKKKENLSIHAKKKARALAKEETFSHSLKIGRLRDKKRLKFLHALVFNLPLDEMSAAEVQQNRYGFYRSYDLSNIFNSNYNKIVKEKALWDFLFWVEDNSKIIEDHDNNLEYLINIYKYKLYWIISLSDFKLKARKGEEQLTELIEKLFSKYELPKFASSPWLTRYQDFDRKEKEVDWFLHLASGRNIRSAAKLPIDLTAKQAHLFLSAPASCTYPQAMLFAVLKSMKADASLINEIINSFIVTTFDEKGKIANLEFWKTVFQFFVQNSFLHRKQVVPVLDYIQEQKFIRNAPHPGFSMAGRNPAILLDQVRTWHRELQNMKRSGNFLWAKKIGMFQYEGGDFKKWKVTELTSSDELFAEGKALRHCVASYDQRAFRGEVSICSVKVNGDRALTVQVNWPQGEVVQARGLANRMPNHKEQEFLARWLEESKITLRNY